MNRDIKLLNRIIRDLKTELRETGNSIDDEALKGAQRYTIKFLQCWKGIIKDEEEKIEKIDFYGWNEETQRLIKDKIKNINI